MQSGCGPQQVFCYVARLQEQRRLFAEWLAGRVWLPRPLGRAIGRWTLLLRTWRDSAATEEDFQVQLCSLRTLCSDLPACILTCAESSAADRLLTAACCWYPPPPLQLVLALAAPTGGPWPAASSLVPRLSGLQTTLPAHDRCVAAAVRRVGGAASRRRPPGRPPNPGALTHGRRARRCSCTTRG